MRLNRSLSCIAALLAAAAACRHAAAQTSATESGANRPDPAGQELAARLTDSSPPSPLGEAAEPAAPALTAARQHAEERPFTYLTDPSTPSPGDVTLEYTLGYGSGTAADRPLPSTVAATGAEHALTLGYGVTSRIAPSASLRLLQPVRGGGAAQATANAGARFQITDPESTHLRSTLSTMLFREFEGSFGAYARIALSYDIERLRLAANVHFERVFASGRDPVDVLVLGGASYRLFSALRVGVEYVGQDLEEAIDSEDSAEGGAHHYIGPSAALSLLSEKLQISAGAAAGLGVKSQSLVGRMAILMTF
jgi:hypothetical protein